MLNNYQENAKKIISMFLGEAELSLVSISVYFPAATSGPSGDPCHTLQCHKMINSGC
jgi:hypothetical protein